jgi:hypothetical protein
MVEKVGKRDVGVHKETTKLKTTILYIKTKLEIN